MYAFACCLRFPLSTVLGNIIFLILVLKPMRGCIRFMFIAAFENCFTSSAHDLHVNWQHGVIRSSREKQMSSDLLGTVPFHFVPFWGPGNTVKSFLPCLLIPVHVLGSNTNRKVYSYKNMPISNYFSTWGSGSSQQVHSTKD